MHLQRGNAFLWMRLRVSQSWREGETCLMKQPLKHADLILADNPSSNPPGILLGCCMAHSEKSNPVPSKRWTETGRTATQTQSDSIFSEHPHKDSSFWQERSWQKKSYRKVLFPWRKRQVYTQITRQYQMVFFPQAQVYSLHILKTSECVFAFLSNKRWLETLFLSGMLISCCTWK